MKTRAETVKHIDWQFNRKTAEEQRPKGLNWHYGKQELRELLDFIYEGEPTNPDEEIV